MLKPEAMFEILVVKAKEWNNIFLVSLIGAPIQDGGWRERRMFIIIVMTHLKLLDFILILFIFLFWTMMDHVIMVTW